MATYDDAIDDFLIISYPTAQKVDQATTLIDGIYTTDSAGGPPTGYGTTVPQHTIGFHEAQFFYGFNAGYDAIDTIKFRDTTQLGGIYTQALADALIFMAELPQPAQGVSLTSGIGLHLSQLLARTVTVLDILGLADVSMTNNVSNLSLLDSLAFDDNITDFFGLGDVQGISFHDAFTPTFQFNKAVASGLGLHSSLLANTLFMRVVDDDLGIDDETLVNAIYEGDDVILSDTMQFSIATVDPGGGFTTWAINTRTSAVTEYQNYVFNSFAQIGSEFYGASDDGLYLLNNQTDNGTNIATDIKGALLALGGSRFTQLDGVYLGIRVNDNAREFVLKLITPGINNQDAGKTFIYSFQAKNMMTTRVNIGKGLRTRYMQWELVTDGADYDLDSIEFVPLISKRRV